MFYLEIIAVILGIASVFLMTKQRPIAWPIGLAMVCLYIVIFYDTRLYSEMLLQCVYALLQLFGWWQWLKGKNSEQALQVSLLGKTAFFYALLAGAGMSLVLGFAMQTYTDANLPWLDASLTGFSLVAQYLMAKKFLQCWALWFVLDIAYVGMFLSLGLYLTALLYVVFVGIAAFGWLEWRKSL